MKITKETWTRLSSNLKSKLLAKYDPTTLVPPDNDLRELLNIPHKGFYLTILDSSKKKVLRVGSLSDGNNVSDSGNKIIEAAFIELQAKSISSKKLLTSTFYFTCVWDIIHSNNGLAWNENEDGVYLSWGDRYKAMYLPVEIQQMTVPKTEIMNRLCSWEANLPSNLWRLPECMVWILRCDSYMV